MSPEDAREREFRELLGRVYVAHGPGVRTEEEDRDDDR